MRTQINELWSCNFFYAAYWSELKNTLNFSKLGYSPPFHEPIIFKKNPDFLIIKNDYCFIVECKSGHFQIDSHNKQAEGYSNLSLRDVEDECRKIMHDKKYSINNFDVAFQFYKKMIDEAENNHSTDFAKLKNKVHVFSCEKGKKYKLYTNRNLIDKKATAELKKGFDLPDPPDFRYILTRNADENLLAHAIINFGLKKISVLPDPIEFDLNDENLCGHYNIPINNIKRTCTILENLKIIKKISGKEDKDKFVLPRYQFTKKSLLKFGIPLINELFNNKNLRDIVANDLKPLESYDADIDVT